MSPGIWQILLVLLLALLLFGGRGKISSIMGDLARGITSFRKGLKEDDSEASAKGIEDGGTTVEVTPENKTESDKTDA